MTLQLVGSLVAVLAVTGLAWLLGLGGAKLAEGEAASTAEHLLSGFAPEEERLSADGQAAIVFGNGGEVALVRRHGARFVAQRAVRPIAVEQSGATLKVSSGERLLGPFTMALASEAEADELTSMLAKPDHA